MLGATYVQDGKAGRVCAWIDQDKCTHRRQMHLSSVTSATLVAAKPYSGTHSGKLEDVSSMISM